MINKQKEYGQVFTPKYIVDIMLDKIGYKDENIIDKKIMEPSFGKGVFICTIIKRLVEYCISIGKDNEFIKKQLENNIYGIEIDKDLYNKTIKCANDTAGIYGINNINWNFYNIDALTYTDKNCFDYIIGNPPYVKIRNMSQSKRDMLKDFKFCTGTTDMYISFFELGINMLNSKGVLAYITPNSYIKNSSQNNFRQYLLDNNLLSEIIDFKCYKVFDSVSTYTAITILSKGKLEDNVIYEQYEKDKCLYKNIMNIKKFKEENIAAISGAWILDTLENQNFINNVWNRRHRLGDICTIQYGIVTNLDKVYISVPEKTNDTDNVLFNGYKVEKELLRPVIKNKTARNHSRTMIMFPYYWDKEAKTYKPIKEDKLKKLYPLSYNYLNIHKEALLKRDIEKDGVWYQFGRSHGLANSRKEKIVLGRIITNDINSFYIKKIDDRTLISADMFITAKDGYSIDYIVSLLSNNDFVRYCYIIGKPLSGDYRRISGKLISEYRF